MLDPGFTAAYFDYGGLYAYGRQPEALLWNLARLAECLLPLADIELLRAALAAFEPALRRDYAAAVLWRLGLRSGGEAADAGLAAAFTAALQETQAPFEQAFFDWRGGARTAAYDAPAWAPVHAALAGFEPAPDANAGHPYFARATPCTMLIEEVEAIWAPIAEADDWSAFHDRLAEIAVMAEAYGTAPK
jgi:serine/tyrosine/threonine adenylyltransferase